MPYDLSVYDEQFFSTNQWEGLRHAEWFPALLQEIFHPKTMIDVGCGTGHFVAKAHELGIEAWGVEGAEAAMASCLAPTWVVPRTDLRKPFRFGPKLDLAISIEVAEHIEGEYAGVFVDTLCALSDTMVLTAAPPGQGGFQHVNEQPMRYWNELFVKRGYQLDMQATADLIVGIHNAQDTGHHVATWWLSNVVCFRRRRDAQD